MVTLSYVPQKAFLLNIDNQLVDYSTEEGLEKIEQKLTYESLHGIIMLIRICRAYNFYLVII